MAIEVELPDGTLVEFPDGTPPEVMKAAMAKRFSPQAAARPSIEQAARQALEMNPAVMAVRAIPSVARAAQGDAAEDLDSAVGSSAFRDARWTASKDRGYFENLGRERRETMAAVFGNDEDLTRELAGGVPGAQITQDANGNPVIELPSGERVYPNQPGLDAQDAVRFAGNAASYLPAVRVARYVTGLIPRALTMAGLTGATNVAGQVGAGREEVDGREAATAAAFGGFAELGAPLVGKVIQAMQRGGGRGEARAAEILKRDLGVEQPTVGQVQAFTRALDEIDAGANPAAILGADEFGFIYTRGQRLPEGQAKFKALTQEEGLRQDGGMAGERLRSVERGNRDALERAISERVESFGGRAPPRTPVEAMEQATERVRTMSGDLGGRVDAAYKAAGQIDNAAVSADAVRQVPDRLRRALREFPQDPSLTPATRSILNEISAKTAAMGDDVKGVTLKAIEEQRRIINNSFGATGANATDRAALRVLKREYDAWADDAFESALVNGDESALAAMKEARGLRTEFGRRFDGDADVDKFIIQMIEGDRTPDELLNVALGASQVSKASAARYVERLKAATDNDPDVIGALRAAHLMRLTQGKNGEMLGAQAIRSNILNAEQNTPSVLRSLYEPEQWAQLKRLATSLEPMIPKGDFARSSGSIERLMRATGALPFIGRGVEAMKVPVRVWQADAAVSRLAPLPTGPASIPATSAAAGDAR